MENTISILKGIHPGIVLDRELKKRKLPKGRFAISIGEYPQTIGSITKGKRDMNTNLSLKIEHALHLDEGYFMILQVYHDIERLKLKQQEKYRPNLSVFRPVLFWDTDINQIFWDKQSKQVILRVFDRGNDQEKEEIIRFYGKKLVDKILNDRQNRNDLPFNNKH